MAEVVETVDVDVMCPTCSERRYVSVRPIGLKETLTASLFKPVGDAPPMADGQPLLCHACNSLMKFSRGLRQKALPSRAEMMSHREEAARDTSPEIRTLFEVKQGEELRDIREDPDGFLIITNKRIVRVSV